MRAIRASRVLIVAHHTADCPELAEAVARRANEGACIFTLLVPARPRGLHRVTDPGLHRVTDPDLHRVADPGLHRVTDLDREGISEAEERLELAIPLLSEAAGAPIIGVVGTHRPLAAVQDALNVLGFDEVIISMLPVRESRWFHLELPRKVRALGVPVTEVITAAREVGHSAA